MDVKEILLIGLAVGAGYWAYANYFQDGQQSYDEVQWQSNADAMGKCIERERAYTRLAATAGVESNEEKMASACAERLNFYLEDGHWKSY